MKKLTTLFIFTTLFTLAQTFDVDISMDTQKDCSYGKWELDFIQPTNINNMFKGRLIDTRDDKYPRSPYYVEYTGIEIFQKKLYQEFFLKQGFYSLEWVAAKDTIGDEMWRVTQNTKKLLKESEFYKTYHEQDGWEETDWNMMLADYLNSNINSIPSYHFRISNLTRTPLTITGFYAKTIFTTGGEASPGGAYFPTENRVNYFPLHWNHQNILKLQTPITLNAKEQKTVPMAIEVNKGARGDGPGRLTVALYVKYTKGKKEQEELIAIISQSEDNGYQTGW